MKVFVVTGEYPTSENGEVVWIAGVANSYSAALRIAETDATEYRLNNENAENIVVEGKLFDEDGYAHDEAESEERIDNWFVWYEIHEHEVQES